MYFFDRELVFAVQGFNSSESVIFLGILECAPGHEFLQCPILFNNRFLRERGMASTPKMEYQVFLCIFQKNSAMATLGLKEMGKFLWKGRKKGLPCWLSQFSKPKVAIAKFIGKMQKKIWYYFPPRRSVKSNDKLLPKYLIKKSPKQSFPIFFVCFVLF